MDASINTCKFYNILIFCSHFVLDFAQNTCVERTYSRSHTHTHEHPKNFMGDTTHNYEPPTIHTSGNKKRKAAKTKRESHMLSGISKEIYASNQKSENDNENDTSPPHSKKRKISTITNNNKIEMQPPQHHHREITYAHSNNNSTHKT